MSTIRLARGTQSRNEGQAGGREGAAEARTVPSSGQRGTVATGRGLDQGRSTKREAKREKGLTESGKRNRDTEMGWRSMQSQRDTKRLSWGKTHRDRGRQKRQE